MDLRWFLFSASFRALFIVHFGLWDFPAQIAGTGSRPLARRPRDVESKQRFSFVGFFANFCRRLSFAPLGRSRRVGRSYGLCLKIFLDIAENELLKVAPAFRKSVFSPKRILQKWRSTVNA